MTTKHEIEIPDLPEGWRAVAYRNANSGEFVIGPDGVEQIRGSITKTTARYLIVEKIKPRRVALEETGEFRQVACGEYYFSPTYNSVRLWVEIHKSSNEYEIWRIVEEEQ